MARIRTIKPEFWTSEQIAECTPLARLLFIGALNFCDDSGVHPANAKRLKMEIYPADDITTENIQRMLDELSTNGLIEFYTVDNKDYFIVTGWGNHQRIDQPTYKYPLQNGETPKTVRRTFNRHSPPERKGSGSGSGKEGKEKTRVRASRLTVEKIPDEWKTWTKKHNPQIDTKTVFDTFRDYWIALAGQKGLKADWFATWRNWVRRDFPAKTAALPQGETLAPGISAFNPDGSVREGDEKYVA